MEKTIKIGKTKVKLNNNIGWVRAYRSQFGHDILPTIMPIVATVLDLLGAFISAGGGDSTVSIAKLIEMADSDKMLDAVIHASGFEAVELVNITWALAKCANPDIDEPEEWEKQFESFPMDIVVPAVGKLIIDGVVSTKNLERLESLKMTIRPKETQTTNL